MIARALTVPAIFATEAALMEEKKLLLMVEEKSILMGARKPTMEAIN